MHDLDWSATSWSRGWSLVATAVELDCWYVKCCCLPSKVCKSFCFWKLCCCVMLLCGWMAVPCIFLFFLVCFFVFWYYGWLSLVLLLNFRIKGEKLCYPFIIYPHTCSSHNYWIVSVIARVGRGKSSFIAAVCCIVTGSLLWYCVLFCQ